MLGDGMLAMTGVLSLCQLTDLENAFMTSLLMLL